MLEIGSLAFATPWMLVALATLPVLWWLLRVTPPTPRLMAFPPLRLLLALRKQQETPARTPWWLILMRILLAAAVIVALAHPLINPGAQLYGSGPMLLVVDDGWASASHWRERAAVIDGLIDRAERADRPVVVLATAPSQPGEPVQASGVLRASEARRIVRAMAPKPWPSDHRAAAAAVDRIEATGAAHVAWISDGLENEATQALADRLQRRGSLQVYAEPAEATARLIGTPRSEGSDLVVTVQRAGSRGESELWLRAVAADGRLLTRERARFADGATAAEARLALPGELRNAAARIEVEGEATAGAVFLLDERWRRRPVGLVSGETLETAQPLLGSLFYLNRALAPFSEVRQGSLSDLLSREIAVIALADVGRLTDAQVDTLSAWIDKGGVVIRFAGPRLAQSADSLVPVQLRTGDRALGGVLSWSKPAELAPFDDKSPFNGLAIPSDVRINRQVLAEPSADLNDKTWARLTDGTPLVTGERRGSGYLILVHTTANSDWSNLPISGLFVEMLRRVVGMSAGVVGEDAEAVYPPLEALDGFGRLGAPPSTAAAIPGRTFEEAKPSPRTPPGYYGRDAARRALNLNAGVPALRPLGDLPSGVERLGFGSAAATDLKPWFLLAALILALVDTVVSFALRGLIWLPRGARAAGATAAVAIAVVALAGTAALAQSPLRIQMPPPGQAPAPERPPRTGPDAAALNATLETHLAYVTTGDAAIDNVSRAGLNGLTTMLRRRTAVEPAAPMAVDLDRDELAFFPVLYWAVSPRQPALSDRAIGKLNDYFRTGGTILFDTREQGGLSSNAYGTSGPASQRLRSLLSALDIPALMTVPEDHVLGRAFYLLQDFPGRFTGGAVWVERRGGNHNDGVSSVVIGGHDWAGAWAVDDSGQPMFPVVPGGERQREFAYRFGVNWVMYALTGNYKTDQVHAPAIIERLGQ
ncbi:MAG: DUF4159 domain-containing protein [Rhodospirillales bacterium]